QLGCRLDLRHTAHPDKPILTLVCRPENAGADPTNGTRARRGKRLRVVPFDPQYDRCNRTGERFHRFAAQPVSRRLTAENTRELRDPPLTLARPWTRRNMENDAAHSRLVL